MILLGRFDSTQEEAWVWREVKYLTVNVVIKVWFKSEHRCARTHSHLPFAIWSGAAATRALCSLLQVSLCSCVITWSSVQQKILHVRKGEGCTWRLGMFPTLLMIHTTSTPWELPASHPQSALSVATVAGSTDVSNAWNRPVTGCTTCFLLVSNCRDNCTACLNGQMIQW